MLNIRQGATSEIVTKRTKTGPSGSGLAALAEMPLGDGEMRRRFDKQTLNKVSFSRARPPAPLPPNTTQPKPCHLPLSIPPSLPLKLIHRGDLSPFLPRPLETKAQRPCSQSVARDKRTRHGRQEERTRRPGRGMVRAEGLRLMSFSPLPNWRLVWLSLGKRTGGRLNWRRVGFPGWSGRVAVLLCLGGCDSSVTTVIRRHRPLHLRRHPPRP